MIQTKWAAHNVGRRLGLDVYVMCKLFIYSLYGRHGADQ
jgi:hypothetical protein